MQIQVNLIRLYFFNIEIKQNYLNCFNKFLQFLKV